MYLHIFILCILFHKLQERKLSYYKFRRKTCMVWEHHMAVPYMIGREYSHVVLRDHASISLSLEHVAALKKVVILMISNEGL